MVSGHSKVNSGSLMLGVAIGENTDFRKMLSFTMVLKFVEMIMKMNKLLVGCYFLYVKTSTRTLVKKASL